jgi:Mce-associated membrane protein
MSGVPDSPTSRILPSPWSAFAVDEPDKVDEAGDPVESGEPTEPNVASEPPGRRVGLLTWLFLAAAVVAVVAAFLSWRDADGDPERDRAALRDSALIEGTAAVETMNSMDHRDVDAGIKAWQGVTTGVLHDQLMSIGADEKQMLADQGKIATGRVVQAALTDLTDRDATLITAVEVTVRSEDGTEEPTVKRNRFSADLVLVDGHWEIENLQQVAVSL